MHKNKKIVSKLCNYFGFGKTIV